MTSHSHLTPWLTCSEVIIWRCIIASNRADTEPLVAVPHCATVQQPLAARRGAAAIALGGGAALRGQSGPYSCTKYG
jgi:hypothetical protein